MSSVDPTREAASDAADTSGAGANQPAKRPQDIEAALTTIWKEVAGERTGSQRSTEKTIRCGQS